MSINLKLNSLKKPILIIILVLLILNIVQFSYIVKRESAVDFFVQSRINRDESLNKISTTYKTILDDKNVSEETKKTIEQKFKDLVSNTEMENKIETILKAKSFEDSFVTILDDKVSVAVRDKNKKINSQDAKVIQDVIVEAAHINDVEIVVKN